MLKVGDKVKIKDRESLIELRNSGFPIPNPMLRHSGKTYTITERGKQRQTRFGDGYCYVLDTPLRWFWSNVCFEDPQESLIINFV
jgi:hypothetical protein